MSLLANHGLIVSGPFSPPSIVQSRRQTGTQTPTFSFVSTPTDGNLIIIVAISLQLRQPIGPSGFTRLDSSGVNKRTSIWYKIASSESNSYSFNFQASSNSAGHLYEINNYNLSSLKILGETVSGGSVTTTTSAVGTVNKNHLAICGVGLSGSISALSFSNSFTGQLPSAANSYSATAHRIYTQTEVNQSTDVSWTTSVEASTVLFKIGGI